MSKRIDRSKVRILRDMRVRGTVDVNDEGAAYLNKYIERQTKRQIVLEKQAAGARREPPSDGRTSTREIPTTIGAESSYLAQLKRHKAAIDANCHGQASQPCSPVIKPAPSAKWLKLSVISATPPT